MPVTDFQVSTTIITQTSLSTRDDDDIQVLLKLDDDGDGTFQLSDPDNDDNYVEADVRALDSLIDRLLRAREIRDQLLGH